MSDMFGAPIGISQARGDAVREAVGAAQAMKALKELEQAPADLALKQAHARLYTAEAAKAEAATAEDVAWKELVRKGLGGDPAAAQQVLAEAGNAPEVRANRSPAAPLYRLADMAGRAGLVGKQADLLTKATTIDSHVATAANARSNQALHQIDAQRKMWEQVGSMAYAALNNPAAYPQLRLQAEGLGMDTSKLPMDFASAAPILKTLVDRSIPALEQLKLRDAEIKQRDQKRNVDSAIQQRNTRMGLMRTREKLLKEQLATYIKNGGAESPEARAARDSLRRLRDTRTEMNERQLYQPAPAKPSDADVGKTFKSPTGKLGVYMGNGQWRVVQAPAATAPSASRPAADDFSDLDGED